MTRFGMATYLAGIVDPDMSEISADALLNVALRIGLVDLTYVEKTPCYSIAETGTDTLPDEFIRQRLAETIRGL